MSTLPPLNPTSPREKRKPLPTPRALLTTLINAISNIPLLPDPAPPDEEPSRRRHLSDHTNLSKNTNPLCRVPASHRPLIVTLHVLFPNLLLPALDLLERGLVGRVALAPAGGGQQQVGDGPAPAAAAAAAAAGTDERQQQQPQQQQPRANLLGGRSEDQPNRSDSNHPSPFFYLVLSSSSAPAGGGGGGAAPPRRRRKHSDDGAETLRKASSPPSSYVVRLGAWNCTCAAFAFAFASAAPPPPPPVATAAAAAAVLSEGEGGGNGGFFAEGQGAERAAQDTGNEREADVCWAGGDAGREAGADDDDDDDDGWSFGGMSLDGLTGGGEGVPVCKHLLACLLAERWHAALGRYVVERRVGREEMTGIVADV